MGIRGIPETAAEYERFNQDYERANFRFTPASRRVADSTRDLFVSWMLPRPLWPLAYPLVYALMDRPLLEAFGYPAQPAWLCRLAAGGLRLRGRLAGLLPDRRSPRLRTGRKVASYPDGYKVAELGSPEPADLAAEWRRQPASERRDA